MSDPLRISTRVKLLELTKPDAANPDIKRWLARAEELEAWISRGGQSETDPHKPASKAIPQDRNTPQSQGPAPRK
jgi:hypothetical protein